MKSFFMTYRMVTSIFLMLLFTFGCATKKPAVVTAAISGDIPTIKSLRVAGQNINECDSAGTTALMHAITNKQPETIRYLIDSGADLKIKDKNGFDALMCAVEYHQIETMKLLIDNGADVDSRNIQGDIPLYPPLFVAIYQGFTDCVKLLLENGANVWAATNENYQKTILDYALYHGQKDVAASIGAKLWEPRPGKARIFLLVEGLYDYVWVKIGEHRKYLSRGPGSGFIDVDPGIYSVTVDYENADKAKPTLSIDTIAGQTYFFNVTQNMKHRIFVLPASLVDTISGSNPFSIMPLNETDAKDKITGFR